MGTHTKKKKKTTTFELNPSMPCHNSSFSSFLCFLNKKDMKGRTDKDFSIRTDEGNTVTKEESLE